MTKRPAPKTPSPPAPASEKTQPRSHANRNLNKHRMMVASVRARKAFELHLAGYGWDEIAKMQGYANRSGAWLAADRWMKRLVQVPAEKVRRIELERLRELLKTLWARATARKTSKSKFEAIAHIIRIMERVAKLQGLDMPVKIAPTNPVGDQAYDPLHLYIPDNQRDSALDAPPTPSEPKP